MSKRKQTPLDIVLERFGFNGADLADALDVHRSTVSHWRKRLNGGIPADTVKDIVRLVRRRGVVLSADEILGC